MSIELEVKKRVKGQAAELRSQGVLPGVVYGPTTKPINVSIDRVAFDKVLAEAGESTIISLKGEIDPVDVLIHDVAFNPTASGVLHVDFYAIEHGKELTTNVPLEFVGEAPAVKKGGVLTKPLHEVEVTCKPSDLPHSIEVDVSTLVELDAAIHVSDLKLPAGVKMENEGSEIVAVVVPVAEETESATTVDMSAIEVEKKGKEEAPAE